MTPEFLTALRPRFKGTISRFATFLAHVEEDVAAHALALRAIAGEFEIEARDGYYAFVGVPITERTRPEAQLDLFDSDVA